MYIIHIFTGYEVVIRIRKPKKDIQDTGKVKKGQRVKQRSTKYYTQKLMIEQHKSYQKHV
jgi:hypothetical protein